MSNDKSMFSYFTDICTYAISLSTKKGEIPEIYKVFQSTLCTYHSIMVIKTMVIDIIIISIVY